MPRLGRRNIPKILTEYLLDKQGNLCFYCYVPFGTAVKLNDRYVILNPHHDHLIPYSLTQDDYPGNLVMACCVCNQAKSNTVFESIQQARNELKDWWRKHEPIYYTESPPKELTCSWCQTPIEVGSYCTYKCYQRHKGYIGRLDAWDQSCE